MPARASSCSTTSRPASRLGAAEAVLPIVGDIGDQALVASLIESTASKRSSISPPRSSSRNRCSDPLGYYGNNTVNSRALIETAVKGGVRHFIFSSTAAVYGNPARVPVAEDDPTRAALALWLVQADDRNHAARRQRGAWAWPRGAALLQRRRRRSPIADRAIRRRGATHLIKVAVEAALGRRAQIDVFGTDYPTPDGTCVRNYIHVSDLARAHLAALTICAPAARAPRSIAVTAVAIRCVRCWMRAAARSGMRLR